MVKKKGSFEAPSNRRPAKLPDKTVGTENANGDETRHETIKVNSHKAKTCLKWNAHETAITSYWGSLWVPDANARS